MNGCKNCGWAEWQLTPTGRIKTRTYGNCTVPAPDIKSLLPSCYTMSYLQKCSIWVDQGEECPTWKPKESV